MNVKHYSARFFKAMAIVPLCVFGAILAEDTLAGDSDEYCVVGLSEGTAQGNVGIGKLHKLCQRSFGRKARMCTTEEVVISPKIVRLLRMGQEGWIQPVIASVVSADGQYQVRDVTGLSVTFEGNPSLSGLSCSQWTQSSGWAGATLARTDQQVIGIDGTFIRKRMCSEQLNVVCCAPHKEKKKKKKDHDED